MPQVSEKAPDAAYWDGVADQLSNFETQVVQDNFIKKKAIVGELLPWDFSKEKILEIGSGNGLIAGILKWANGRIDYQGLDVSERFAKTAEHFFGLKVDVGRVTELPYEDGQFTVAMLFDVCEHIKPEERLKGWAELNRVLNKDRRIVFINNPLSPSLHDEAFDYGFSDSDISTMAEILGMRLSSVKILTAQGNYYQFITMIRVSL